MLCLGVNPSPGTQSKCPPQGTTLPPRVNRPSAAVSPQEPHPRSKAPGEQLWPPSWPGAQELRVSLHRAERRPPLLPHTPTDDHAQQPGGRRGRCPARGEHCSRVSAGGRMWPEIDVTMAAGSAPAACRAGSPPQRKERGPPGARPRKPPPPCSPRGGASSRAPQRSSCTSEPRSSLRGVCGTFILLRAGIAPRALSPADRRGAAWLPDICAPRCDGACTSLPRGPAKRLRAGARPAGIVRGVRPDHPAKPLPAPTRLTIIHSLRGWRASPRAASALPLPLGGAPLLLPGGPSSNTKLGLGLGCDNPCRPAVTPRSPLGWRRAAQGRTELGATHPPLRSPRR